MTQTISPAKDTAPARVGGEPVGYVLVFLSAVVWSFGGAIARFLEVDDSWTVVFWRSSWAAAFLIGFMVWRDGFGGMLVLFRRMGLPGIAVAICFATASTSFVVALSYTTVANIVLMQAGVPLLAALMGWIVFRENVSVPTWIAIAAVISGVAIMVSDSIDGAVSPIGDGLALLIAVAFSTATVITRRYAHVRMTPATCIGTLMAAAFAATQASTFVAGAYRHGLAVRLRRAQSRPRPGAVRHRRAADTGRLRRIARHARNRSRSDLGLADPRRNAVDAHHSRRRRHFRSTARPYRAGIQPQAEAAQARRHRHADAELTAAASPAPFTMTFGKPIQTCRGEKRSIGLPQLQVRTPWEGWSGPVQSKGEAI